MKRVFAVTLAALALAGAAQARSHWIRRLSAVAVCAAAGADLATTAIGSSRGDAERNRFLAHNGRPNWGLTIGLNAAACSSAIVGAATRRVPGYIVVPLNLGFAVPKFSAVAQNIQQLRELK